MSEFIVCTTGVARCPQNTLTHSQSLFPTSAGGTTRQKCEQASWGRTASKKLTSPQPTYDCLARSLCVSSSLSGCSWIAHSHITGVWKCGGTCALAGRCVCHVSVSAAVDTQPHLFPKLIIFPSCQARRWCHRGSERRGGGEEGREG